MNTLKQSISEIKDKNQISVKDIKRWGCDAIDSMKIHGLTKARFFLIVELQKGTEILDKDGKVVAQASKDKVIGFYEEKSGNVGIGKKEDFANIGLVPTLAEINTWNEREQNLSPDEKKLLNAYVKRKVSYHAGSGDIQQMRRNIYNNLIRDKKYLDRVLDEERKYQSKTPEQKRIYDQTERDRKRVLERDLRRDREMLRKKLEQECKGLR